VEGSFQISSKIIRTFKAMKKLLLTGARGFIGSYFQKKYAHKYEIQTFSFLKDDIETLHVKGVETVIHLSALVHQMGGASDEAYERINVEQTLQLARKAKENQVKQFIFMSTVKVYGEESDVAYTEASPCHPEDAYGRSKLKAEQELQALVDEDFTVSIIRTPIVYGRGVKANMQNLMKLVDSMPLLPLRGIDNKRSFVYIGNVCALLDSLIEQEQKGVFLASDDAPLSTTALIQELAKAKKKKLFLIQLPLFAMFLKWLKPSFYKRLFESLTVDNSYTKEVLHFKNPYSTQEGISMMIQGTVQ
jgi:nucleoside-diphosphate-sugar epimerase